jgi:tRNA(Ile)-lysidine synthase
VRDKTLQSIRELTLLRAGDRVGVAVSGGADSVALLRVLLELRAELGIVLAVAHFNHGLRGEESAADEAFVADLARHQGLEFFAGRGDVRDHALTSKLSIEAAGREMRYRWLMSLAQEQRLDAIATAHTLDDQAETVLLKFLRGAGTKGLAGIYPVLDFSAENTGAEAPFLKEGSDDAPEGPLLQRNDLVSGNALSGREIGCTRIARPLLCVSRSEVESYLGGISQPWREDESNLDRRFLRNRVRHELLPLLEREFNPNVRRVLSDLAEVSRGEEKFWQQQVEHELAVRLLLAEDTPERTASLDITGFSLLPLALQRRLLKGFAERQGLTLVFEHVETLRLCALGALPKTEMPSGRIAVSSEKVLTLRLPEGQSATVYRYLLGVPGEIQIAELGLTVRALIVSAEFAQEASPGELLSLDLVGSELVVRNWTPGDRFWPAHSRSEEKLKRLFAEKRIPAAKRPSWPVMLYADKIVWVQGFPVSNAYEWRGTGDALRVEVLGG